MRPQTGDGNQAYRSTMQSVTALARESADRYRAGLEQACEQALQTGTCGVRVVHVAPTSWTFEVTGEVPYGTIHEFPAGRD